MSRFTAITLVLALGGGVATAIIGSGFWGIGVAGVLWGVLLMDGVFRPTSRVFFDAVCRGRDDQPLVGLTFDDGPNPDVTPQVLAVLRQYRARATFFVIGRNVDAFPELAARIVDEGHELSNHSYAHSRWLNFRGAQALKQEILRGDRTVRAVTGRDRSALYRPPIGLRSPPLARVVRQLGIQVVLWSVHGRDTGRVSPERVAGRVLRRVRAGDIILLHDGADRPGCVRTAGLRALPVILEGLRARGLSGVSVSEVLAPAPSKGHNGPRSEAQPSAGCQGEFSSPFRDQ